MLLDLAAFSCCYFREDRSLSGRYHVRPPAGGWGGGTHATRGKLEVCGAGVRGRCAAERLACEPQTYFPSSLPKYVCCSQATEGPEGFKTSPCLRQKMFISPPCLRKEISSECMEQHFPCLRPSASQTL